MSVLLREIRHLKHEAARVLEYAGLRTDSDIQSLTREELLELFPGIHNFKLRRDIFDIIHKQKPVEQLLRHLKDFIPHDSFRAALTNNGVLVDYLRILKDMKTQMNYVQGFLDAHIGFLEEFSTPRPDQESAAGGPVKPQNGRPDDLPQGPQDTFTSDSSRQMVPLTNQTSGHPQEVQDTFTSDSSRQMVPLTNQTGGHPQGAQDTGFIGSIFGRISRFGQTGSHLQEPQKSLSGTSTSAICGPVYPYYGQPDVPPQGTRDTAGTSDSRGQMVPFTNQTGGRPQGAQTTLKYQMVVGGKTFGTHLKLMEKVKDQVQNLVQLCESKTDHEITFVFCPISSRIASDVEAAMVDVKDDKPVILVLMHHTREAKYTTSMRTWRDDAKVVLHVHVFYHETINGLLRCEENNAAVIEIRNKLEESFIQRSSDASGNTWGVGAERVGGNDRHSQVGKSASVPRGHRWPK